MNPVKNHHAIHSEHQTQALATEFAKQLADCLNRPLVVYLTGDLGVGKSVFVRALLRSLGVDGAIKSPTYTLVEQYELADFKLGGAIATAAHIDLYRLVDPEELYFIGFDDVVTRCDLMLIEWPEKGLGQLPKATHEVIISYQVSKGSGARNVCLIEH